MNTEAIREAMGVADTPLKELFALQACLEYLDVCVHEFVDHHNTSVPSNPITGFSYRPDGRRIQFSLAFEDGSFTIVGGSINDNGGLDVSTAPAIEAFIKFSADNGQVQAKFGTSATEHGQPESTGQDIFIDDSV